MGRARDEAGNIWETDAQGNPVRLLSQAQGGTPMGTPNPKLPYEVRQAEVGIPATQASTQRTITQERGDRISNATNAAIAPFSIREAEAKATQQEVAAREAQAKLDKYNSARTKAAAELSNGIGTIDSVQNHLSNTDGWWEVGRSGSFARSGLPWPIGGGKGAEGQPDGWLYAGSDAADFDGRIKPIVSNMALDALKAMRDANPNGTGLGGNTSDRDMRVLETSTADLTPSQTTSGFQQSLRNARSAYVRNLGNIDRAAAGGAIASNPDLQPNDADKILETEYRTLIRNMQGKTPAQRQAMLRAFEAQPVIQGLRRRAPSLNPTRNAPRKGNSNIVSIERIGD